MIYTEILWVFGVPPIPERCYSKNYREKRLFGGHGYWQWQVFMVTTLLKLHFHFRFASLFEYSVHKLNFLLFY